MTTTEDIILNLTRRHVALEKQVETLQEQVSYITGLGCGCHLDGTEDT